MKRKRPVPKTFDIGQYTEVITGLTEHMKEQEFEKICTPIAIHVLQAYENFEHLQEGPKLAGRPFDFFGYKDGNPYIIELKASLKSFNAPGETQKRRIQEVLRAIPGLNIALLQLKLNLGQYRVFYNYEFNIFFEGRQVPIEPIIEWVRRQIV
ncbi:MAG: hypothetical protein M8357_15635 [Desulfobulbaceae bacterium]|nr:hypothetical protein [Desulfobulbaceae bacterium]